MTCTYVKEMSPGEDIHDQDRVIQVLSQHRKDYRDGEARYAISRYIPPNRGPDQIEGISTLFDED